MNADDRRRIALTVAGPLLGAVAGGLIGYAYFTSAAGSDSVARSIVLAVIEEHAPIPLAAMFSSICAIVGMCVGTIPLIIIRYCRLTNAARSPKL